MGVQSFYKSSLPAEVNGASEGVQPVRKRRGLLLVGLIIGVGVISGDGGSGRARIKVDKATRFTPDERKALANLKAVRDG